VEKPITLRPWNVEGLTHTSQQTGKQIFTILQLRLHEQAIALKKKVEDLLVKNPEHVVDVDLTYITSRGNWYYASWKGDEEKSGGIATNIGVHFFDLLQWIFGAPLEQRVFVRTHDRASGVIEFSNARVKWFLSINASTLPEEALQKGQNTFRSLTMDQWSFDFSEGFNDLHTASYAHILAGQGFNETHAQPAIAMVHEMRELALSEPDHFTHQLAKLPLSDHPFFRKR
jgi:UDP-N-acetyl-2-amino-2-deoxyglucuronate dehydrogenase